MRHARVAQWWLVGPPHAPQHAAPCSVVSSTAMLTKARCPAWQHTAPAGAALPRLATPPPTPPLLTPLPAPTLVPPLHARPTRSWLQPRTPNAKRASVPARMALTDLERALARAADAEEGGAGGLVVVSEAHGLVVYQVHRVRGAGGVPRAQG